MAKKRGATLGFTFSVYDGPADRFCIEVRGLSTGRWCPQTTCISDDAKCVRETMRAQGSEWMLDKREHRVVPL